MYAGLYRVILENKISKKTEKLQKDESVIALLMKKEERNEGVALNLWNEK